MESKIVADDNLFLNFLQKIRFDMSCDSSAHWNVKPDFLWKITKLILECCQLQIWFEFKGLINLNQILACCKQHFTDSISKSFFYSFPNNSTL